MNERFEHLTADALHLADDELLHIAETAQCTDAQTARIMQMAKQKAGFAETLAKPVQHKKRVKVLGVLIAAAIAAVGATFGVSAYINRNSDMLNNLFGVDGAEQVTLAEFPAPVQYTNGEASITVETVLNDGNRAWLLLSGETADGLAYNWNLPFRAQTVDEDGAFSFRCFGGHSFGFEWDWDGVPQSNPEFSGGSRYFVYHFNPAEITADEPVYLIFVSDDETVDNPFEGIRIPLVSAVGAQNTPMNTYVSDCGDEILLSGYEIVYNMLVNTDMSVYSPNPDIQLITNDDVRHTVQSDGAVREQIRGEEIENGMQLMCCHASIVIPQDEADWADIDFTRPNLRGDALSPEKTIRLIDVNEVKAIEMDGVLYTLAE